MPMLTGDRGKFKVGYQTAATLRDCTVVRQQEAIGQCTVTLTAIIHSIDGFWSRQRPLTVGIWMGASWWVWEVLLIDGAITVGAVVTASLSSNPVAHTIF